MRKPKDRGAVGLEPHRRQQEKEGTGEGGHHRGRNCTCLFSWMGEANLEKERTDTQRNQWQVGNFRENIDPTGGRIKSLAVVEIVLGESYILCRT